MDFNDLGEQNKQTWLFSQMYKDQSIDPTILFLIEMIIRRPSAYSITLHLSWDVLNQDEMKLT